MKVLSVLSALPELEKLSEKHLPIKTSFNLALLLKKLLPIRDEYEKLRIKLVTKYGVKSDDGNLSVPKEKIQEFINELQPVVDAEVDLVFTPLKLDELGFEAGLTAKDLMQLGDFITI